MGVDEAQALRWHPFRVGFSIEKVGQGQQGLETLDSNKKSHGALFGRETHQLSEPRESAIRNARGIS